MTVSQAARRYGISRQSVYNALKAAGVTEYKGPGGELTADALACLAARFTPVDTPDSLDTPGKCQVDTGDGVGTCQVDATLDTGTGEKCQVDTQDKTDTCQPVNQSVNLDGTTCQVDSTDTPGKCQVDTGGEPATCQVDTPGDGGTCQVDTPAAAADCQVDTQQGATLDNTTQGTGAPVEAGRVDALAVEVARLTAERDALAERVAEQARMIDTLTSALQEAQAATSRAQALTAGAINALQPPAITDGTERHRRTIWQRMGDLFKGRQ